MAAQVLQQQVQVVGPDAVAAPAGEDAGEREDGAGVQAAHGDERVGRPVELDPHEGGQRDDAEPQERADVRVGPRHQRGLVEGEVDEHQAGHARGRAEPVERRGGTVAAACAAAAAAAAAALLLGCGGADGRRRGG